MTANKLSSAFICIVISKLLTATVMVLADCQVGSKLMTSVSPMNTLQSSGNPVISQGADRHRIIEIKHQPCATNKMSPFSIQKISLQPIGPPVAKVTSSSQFTAGKFIPAKSPTKIPNDIFAKSKDCKPIDIQFNQGAQIVANPVTPALNPISFSLTSFYPNQITQTSSSIPTNILSTPNQMTAQQPSIQANIVSHPNQISNLQPSIPTNIVSLPNQITSQQPIQNIPSTPQIINQAPIPQAQISSVPLQSNSVPMQYLPNQFPQYPNNFPFQNSAPQMDSSRPSPMKLLLPLLMNMLQEKGCQNSCNCRCNKNMDHCEPNYQSIYDSQVNKAFDFDQDEYDPYIYPGILKERKTLKKISIEDDDSSEDSCEYESD